MTSDVQGRTSADVATGQGKPRQRHIARPKVELLGGRGVLSRRAPRHCSWTAPIVTYLSSLTSSNSASTTLSSLLFPVGPSAPSAPCAACACLEASS